jgi:inorganic pyrophosphatase
VATDSGATRQTLAMNDSWVHVVVEIPKGSRNKYEMDHDTNRVWLDRHLFTATAYPADYGFIHDTLGEDGDPLDALVLLEEPTFPGCHIRARAVGVFHMEDEAGPDAKILCVPHGDPRWESLRDLGDVPQHLLSEVTHFFEVYKALEPSKHSAVSDWEDRSSALRLITEAKERFLDQPH